jgi:hypothetical protein
MRGIALGGLLLKELSDQKRDELNLKPNELALTVDHVGEYGTHAAAKNAGFWKGDVLVALDGVQEPMSESRLIGHILSHHAQPQSIKAIVLRDNQRIELRLPVQ